MFCLVWEFAVERSTLRRWCCDFLTVELGAKMVPWQVRDATKKWRGSDNRDRTWLPLRWYICHRLLAGI